jgi:hypothetical protein
MKISKQLFQTRPKIKLMKPIRAAGRGEFFHLAGLCQGTDLGESPSLALAIRTQVSDHFRKMLNTLEQWFTVI